MQVLIYINMQNTYKNVEIQLKVKKKKKRGYILNNLILKKCANFKHLCENADYLPNWDAVDINLLPWTELG